MANTHKKTDKKTDKECSTNLCTISKKCGGCSYINMPYKRQLSLKQETIQKLLGEFGKTETIVGMDNPYHYRNKVHAVYDYKKGKGIVSGIYRENSHEVVPVEQCMIENEKADQIVVSVRELAKSFKMKIFDEDTGYGLLRHILVRVGHMTGQIMVVLVLSSPILPSKKNFVNALRKLHPEITTIIVNVNNKKTSMILGDKEQVIYGKGYIEDVLCGKTFRISPKSFYQINSVQTEKLYNIAIQMAGLSGYETVMDAYCGIGTIGLAAADKAKKVFGVELNPDAVKDAIVNAKANGIKNVVFYQKDAGRHMLQLAKAKEKIDVMFMDPPRSGSTKKFMDAVFSLEPKRIVYISCNPETLARDLRYMKGKYRVEKIVPVDMFPFTTHVETVCLLSRKH